MRVKPLGLFQPRSYSMVVLHGRTPRSYSTVVLHGRTPWSYSTGMDKSQPSGRSLYTQSKSRAQHGEKGFNIRLDCERNVLDLGFLGTPPGQLCVETARRRHSGGLIVEDVSWRTEGFLREFSVPQCVVLVAFQPVSVLGLNITGTKPGRNAMRSMLKTFFEFKTKYVSLCIRNNIYKGPSRQSRLGFTNTEIRLPHVLGSASLLTSACGLCRVLISDPKHCRVAEPQAVTRYLPSFLPSFFLSLVPSLYSHPQNDSEGK